MPFYPFPSNVRTIHKHLHNVKSFHTDARHCNNNDELKSTVTVHSKYKLLLLLETKFLKWGTSNVDFGIKSMILRTVLTISVVLLAIELYWRGIVMGAAGVRAEFPLFFNRVLIFVSSIVHKAISSPWFPRPFIDLLWIIINSKDKYKAHEMTTRIGYKLYISAHTIYVKRVVAKIMPTARSVHLWTPICS